MKKNISSFFKIGMLISLLMIIISCAETKTFNIDGEEVVVEPYGWANYNVNKHDSINYQVSPESLIWSIIGIETIIIPVYCTGYQFFEPVQKK